MIHGHEVAEAHGQSLGLDGDLGCDRRHQRRHHHGPVAAPLFLGQQGDEGFFQGWRWRCACAVRPAYRWPAPCRHPSPPASRSDPPLPCRRWRRSRSCPGARRGYARSGPRIVCARADRRRWSARPGSAGRDRGSARSRGRVSVSCRPRACPPGATGRAADRCWPSARRCGGGARPRRGRTGGRRTAGSPRPTGSGRGSCPGPAACRQCAGRRCRDGGCWSCRRPAPPPGPAARRAHRPAAPAGWICPRRQARSGRPCRPREYPG